MSLNLNRSTWKRVKLGDVILRSRTQVDPFEGNVDRYVAGGHIDSDSVIISRSGDVADGQMGSTFRYVFKPGQVLFVSARPYLRKSGVPDFAGVVADKTYVLEAVPDNGLLQDMLPFLLASDRFVEYATQEATGSMNPRLLWGPMQRYEFALPPLEEQKHLACLLWAPERHCQSLGSVVEECARVRQAFIRGEFSDTVVATVFLGDAALIASGVTLGPARIAMNLKMPYLRVANVFRNRLNLEEIKEIGATREEVSSKSARSGDVLVVEGHASTSEVGRAAIWDRSENILIQNHLFRVRALPAFRERFLLEAINSPRGRAHILSVAKSTSGLNTINSKALKALPVPAMTIGRQDSFLGKLADLDTARHAVDLEYNRLLAVRQAVVAEIFGDSG